MIETGSLLREARRRAGLTQVEAARRSGIDQTTWSAYERGRREPAAATLRHLQNSISVTEVGGTEVGCSEVGCSEVGVTELDTAQPVSAAKALAEHRREVVAVLAEAGMTNCRVFGSVARGDDSPGSDVDLLVTLTRPMGLFAFLRTQDRLREILGVDVDLVPDTELRPQVEASVTTDAIAL